MVYLENGFYGSHHIYIKVMQDKINYLLANYGIDEQRTSAWFAKRGEMLTASEIWKCFGDATASSRHELILSKLSPPKRNDGPVVGALIWGTRFESIAKEIYCLSEGVKVVELTCVQHPEYAFIGASPDGLVLCDDDRNGRLIELKCPISRPFDDTTPVPDHYYHQMQLQIECTGLNECDYVEMAFKTMNYSQWTETESLHKSCFAVSSSGEVRYRPFNCTDPIHEWQQLLGNPFEWQIIYWTLSHWRKQLVKKDPEWMPTHLPEIKGTWEEIVKHRELKTVPVQKDKGVLVL